MIGKRKYARAYVLASANNTRVTVVERRHIRRRKWEAVTVLHKSAGQLGYKGAKRKGPVSAEDTGRKVGVRLRRLGVSSLTLHFKGLVFTTAAVCKGLLASGVRVSGRTNCTPRPHGGCRPKKPRRV